MTEFATLHLQQRPGTDIALIKRPDAYHPGKGWEDQKFVAERTEGFEEFKALIEQYTPDRVAETTGVPVEQLYEAAEILPRTSRWR